MVMHYMCIFSFLHSRMRTAPSPPLLQSPLSPRCSQLRTGTCTTRFSMNTFDLEPSSPALSTSLSSPPPSSSTRPPDMDRSKPYLPQLERSSQLIEDSFEDFEEERIHITVDPRKRTKKSKTTTSAAGQLH